MTDAPVIHFFTGKGGAGKTTLAVAHALNLLEENGKRKVLLLSIESPGVVADLVDKKLETKPQKISGGKGTGGVFASELSFAEIGDAFAKAWRPKLLAAAAKGSVLSEEDVKKILDASTSSLGDVALFFHLQELAESKEWDAIVVDGPATTHTVRLLECPYQFRKFIGVVRGEKVTGRAAKTAPRPPSPIDDFAAKTEGVQAFLKDAARFSLFVVAVAEPVAESQIKQLMKYVGERGISVHSIVTDMIEDGKPSRETSNRRGLQAPHVRKYQTLHPKVDLIQRRIVGPMGLDEVKKMGQLWASGKETKALQFSPAESPPALVRAPSMPPVAAPPLPPTRFIFFVGVGGVGKSSCSAAAAVTLTEKEGPVLLISVDPSHSLSDVLLGRLTDTETQVKGTKGLYAREIDAGAWFNGLRKKIKEAAEPLFGAEQKGEPFMIDRDLIRNLIDTAPAGIDELAAMFTLTDALVQERFKRIVIDSSPSANVVRMIELPAIVKPWLTALLGVLAKYKNKGGAALIALLESMQRHVERFEKAVANPSECRFVVVARGESLGVGAVERLVEYFRHRQLPIERVLVNRVLPKTTCEITEERRNSELEVGRVVEKKIGMPVTMAPALGRHPAGLRELKAFRTSWYALSSVSSKVQAA
ncbi:MAG: TRC40/GET3/ArsA family transport-energizing ATPase [candidate division KSB1 bacterium]